MYRRFRGQSGRARAIIVVRSTLAPSSSSGGETGLLRTTTARIAIGEGGMVSEVWDLSDFLDCAGFGALPFRNGSDLSDYVLHVLGALRKVNTPTLSSWVYMLELMAQQRPWAWNAVDARCSLLLTRC